MRTCTRLFLLSTCVVLLLASGCANYATLQEPDVIKEGQLVKGGGLSYTSYKVNLTGKDETISVPALVMWGRYGVIENLEAHGYVWIPLGANVGVKYQVLGNRETAGLGLSLGLDLGYLEITSGEGENEVKNGILDVYVPVYVGYRTSPGFVAYLTPKYVLRASMSDSGTSVGHIAGGTLGIAAGQNTQFLIEGSALWDLDVGAPIVQGAIGLTF